MSEVCGSNPDASSIYSVDGDSLYLSLSKNQWALAVTEVHNQYQLTVTTGSMLLEMQHATTLSRYLSSDDSRMTPDDSTNHRP